MVIIAYNELPILSFNPYTLAIQFGFELLQWLGIIPDPIDLLFSLFVGRPRELATVQVIERLQKSPNTAARIWGIELGKMLRNMDIVISDSSAFGQMMLGNSYHQFVTGMEAQGVPNARAQTIALHALSRSAQAGAPLEPELIKPTPAQFVLTGPQAILDTYQEGVSLGQSKLLTGQPLENFAEHYLWTHQSVANLQKLQWVDPQSITPPPPPPPPAPPPPPPGGGGQPSLQPGDDELGGLGNQLCQCLDQIAQAITGQGAPLPNGQIDPCCASIVASIQSIGASLSSVLTLLATGSGSGEPPLDLTPIQTTLQAIADALKASPPNNDANTQKLVDAIRSLTPSASTIDLKPIIDALNTANQLQDVPHEIIQQGISDGVIPSSYSGLLQGTPISWVHAALTILAEFSPIAGYIEHWLGDDKDFLAGQRKLRQDVGHFFGKLRAGWKDLNNVPTPDNEADLAASFSKFLTTEDTVFEPIIKPLIEAVVKLLTPPGGLGCPPVGNVRVDPDAPVAAATGVAFTAAAMACVLSYAGIDLGEPLAKVVELIAGAIGFEELRDVLIGPLIRNGIAKVADMNAKLQFRQQLPGASHVAGLAARRLITNDRLPIFYAYDGLPCELEDATSAAAYHGIQPRQLIRAFESGLFTDADIRDELTFSGMRDVSVNRILRLAPWLATNPQRTALIGAAEKACVDGLLSTNDLLALVDSAEHTTDLHELISQRMALEQRAALVKEYEGAYTSQFLAGITDVPTYQSQLTGLGLQDLKVSALLALAEAKTAATLKRQADAAERSLIRATAAAERRAALQNYKDGVIDAVGLAAALVLTGLTVTQSAAWVDLAVLQKQGSARWLYGLQLQPAQATLLRSRVGALTDQRKKGFLTDPQYHDALAALGIQPPWLNSLMATAAALATPRATAEIIPITTD